MKPTRNKRNMYLSLPLILLLTIVVLLIMPTKAQEMPIQKQKLDVNITIINHTAIIYTNNITGLKKMLYDQNIVKENKSSIVMNLTKRIRKIWKTEYDVGYIGDIAKKVCSNDNLVFRNDYHIISNKSSNKGIKCYSKSLGEFKIVEYHFPYKSTIFLILYIATLILVLMPREQERRKRDDKKHNKE